MRCQFEVGPHLNISVRISGMEFAVRIGCITCQASYRMLRVVKTVTAGSNRRADIRIWPHTADCIHRGNQVTRATTFCGCGA